MKLHIESLKNEHIDDVMVIEEDSFSIPWTKDMLIDDLKNPMSIYLCASVDGVVCGYAGMWHIVNEGHITNIAVKREYRNRGIGRELLKSLFIIAEEREMIGLSLEVRISNITAQRLYTSLGFKPEGIRKGYYNDTKEDAIIMWKYFDIK